jgi:drug/metabolite transporter (DMT)-like permease
MHWIVASLVSAFFLGCYDLSTKHAVRDNAVLPVLFFANVCSAVIWLLLYAGTTLEPHAFAPTLHVDALTRFQHVQLFLKAMIVAASWVCSYFAVKQLPVSLAAPIRATGPVCTLLGATLVLGERPTWLEGLGIVITLASLLGLSVVGAREGIHFRRNRWIWFLGGGTLLGALSGLYDKYLLGSVGFKAATVQCWFSIYLALVFLPLAVGWKLRWWQRQEFQWRGSIVLVSLMLLVADFLYFNALRDPEALVSMVSSLRRGGTLVAFAGGILLFFEVNARAKLPAVIGVVLGIVLTILG